MKITLSQITYDIEPVEKYRGDILLMSDIQDLTFIDGYDQMREEAIKQCGYFERSTGELEYEKENVNAWIESNLIQWIESNVCQADITKHD